MIENNKESINIELNLEAEETINKRHKDGSIPMCPEAEKNIQN